MASHILASPQNTHVESVVGSFMIPTLVHRHTQAWQQQDALGKHEPAKIQRVPGLKIRNAGLREKGSPFFLGLLSADP